MIVDKLENAKCYKGLLPQLTRALELLESGELEALEPGQHQLDGDRLYAVVKGYEPAGTPQDKYEAHRRQMDVHYYLEGTELFGYAPLDTLEEVQSYNEEEDYALYCGSGTMVRMQPGMFFVAFPQDGHLPGIKECDCHIRKIIVRFRID